MTNVVSSARSRRSAIHWLNASVVMDRPRSSRTTIVPCARSSKRSASRRRTSSGVRDFAGSAFTSMTSSGQYREARVSNSSIASRSGPAGGRPTTTIRYFTLAGEKEGPVSPALWIHNLRAHRTSTSTSTSTSTQHKNQQSAISTQPCLSSVDPSQPMNRSNTADRQHVRCRTHVDLVLLGELEDIAETAHHDVAQPVVDDLLAPEIATAILHPLEVRDRHAARIGQDVRDDEDPFLFQNGVCAGGRRAIRTLADHLRANLRRVLGGDHVLECGRDQDVDIEGEQFLVRDGVAFRVHFERLVMLDPVDDVLDIETGGIVDAACAVADRDNLASLTCEELRRD